MRSTALSPSPVYQHSTLQNSYISPFLTSPVYQQHSAERAARHERRIYRHIAQNAFVRMSFRGILSSLNAPPVVTTVGILILVGFPFVPKDVIPLRILQLANVVGFCINAVAVSVPGRIDGEQEVNLQGGDPDPNCTTPVMVSEITPLTYTLDESQNEQSDNSKNDNGNNHHLPVSDSSRSRSNGRSIRRDQLLANRSRTFFAPAGWAFAIWGFIYLGEALFCIAQYLLGPLIAILQEITIPLVIAHLLQSLWCASFRWKYAHGWQKYVSVGMLGGTALALYQIPYEKAIAISSTNQFFLLPFIVHFGWTTAATLVNLNGSIAMTATSVTATTTEDGDDDEDGIEEEDDVSYSTLISIGHASTVIATALGVAVTVYRWLPAYAGTIAWALAACASGTRKFLDREDDSHHYVSDLVHMGASVQKTLCFMGSILCLSAMAFTIIMSG